MKLASLRERLNPHRRSEKAYGRGQRMSTPEILDWIDGSLYSVGRSLSEWRKGERRENRGDERPDEFFLDNARNEAEVVLTLITVLEERERSLTGRRVSSSLL